MDYNVVAKLKIYVDEPANMGEVRRELERTAKVSRIWEEDIGFGIKVLKATFLLNDSAGGMSKLEDDIAKIKHVSQYEVEEVGRIG